MKTKSDSLTGKSETFLDKMQGFARKSEEESKEDFKKDNISLIQLKVINEIRVNTQNAKAFLKSSHDTSAINNHLKSLKSVFATASDGVFTNVGSIQTYRNLASTKRILRELLLSTNTIKGNLDARQKSFAEFHYKLDSLSTVRELFAFPKDSVSVVDYLKILGTLAYETAPMDSVLKARSLQVQKQLNTYNLAISQLTNSIEQVEQYERNMAYNSLTRELPDIWQHPKHFRSLKDIITFSIKKNLLTLKYYVGNNTGKLVLILLLVISSYLYLKALKNIYKRKGLIKNDMSGQLAIRYPLLSAVVIVLSLFQFILISPPFILSLIIWIISAACLSVLFRNFIASYWMKVWLFMVVVLLASSFGNILLQSSRDERWFMLIFSILGSGAGITILLQKRYAELKEKWICYSIGIMVIFEVISAVFNIYGRFNLSKTLFLVGFLNVVISIIFLWVVRLINEGLLLAFDVYTVQDRKLFYLNLGKVGNKAPAILYLLLVLGWLVIMGHNFPQFDLFSRPFLNLLENEHRIGDYSFSINGLLLFFGIMAIAVIISKIVSFFTSDDHLVNSKNEQSIKRGLGSWVLLVRLVILCIGLFLALAAAGIPLDRITIIIGALGVGIGFGLQTLVNNLVSGLIIAFEKPVNVGDLVDVDGQGGTMKSIGFRSSVITTFDGGDLVMPNGDLLNSHLMNWTLAGGRKRMAINVGVGYETDLRQCKMLINGILESEDRILKNPKPVVQFEEFGENAIALKILVWTRTLNENGSTKSDLIIAINESFRQNNIKIPFNQQEIYLHKTEDS
ncbi:MULTISPECIES: mechanosensitive ion channel family protein [Pedobacter]|uniref:mechanosensitive ion channel family protein n=1 Tax=Pedobacter TaxID=84567 RepID=UPI001E3EF1DE|nr:MULTISPECIES: mechanosensitive ion channel domain-containing protein [Pedobacter]